MTAPQAPHILHVQQEPDADENEFQYSITCPNADADNKPCGSYQECPCDGDLRLADDGPCPKSPTGHHQWVSSLGRLGYLTEDCYVQTADDLPDAAQEALSDLGNGGVGDYPVGWSCEGENQLELTVVSQ